MGINKGVIQGCPLSPLIFNMALEPLAIIIREELKGIQAGRTVTKIGGLYADHVVCYLSHPEVSMEILNQILQEFGSVSGYKVNVQKTVLCEFNITEAGKSAIERIMPESGRMMTLDI